jgi:hypothetical protein
MNESSDRRRAVPLFLKASRNGTFEAHPDHRVLQGREMHEVGLLIYIAIEDEY